MKQAYVNINFAQKSLALIGEINKLVNAYSRQGLVLSVRQLYYQLVARSLVPENTQRMYKKVAGLINDGRLAGLIDWDMFEDRNREIDKRAAWESGSAILRVCADQFHMDMWKPQEKRVFLIIEKAALAGVMERTCRQYDIPLLAARGYPSVSVVRELALQYFRPALKAGQRIMVLHFGDHDPSGIDMTRDLKDRIDMFVAGAGLHPSHVELKRMALNRDQIEDQQPPPNFAKETDSRIAGYKEDYPWAVDANGDADSWELDALEPAYLRGLVEAEVNLHIDQDLWRRREDEIKGVQSRLHETARQWEDEE